MYYIMCIKIIEISKSANLINMFRCSQTIHEDFRSFQHFKTYIPSIF